MPQPIQNTKGLSARAGPKTILERQKHAAFLGAVAAEFGNIDSLYLDIFNLITFADFIPVGAHSKSELSNIVFDFFTNYQSKETVIIKIIAARYSDDLAQEFLDISKEIRKKAKERNRLVHCQWNVCEAYPEDIISIEGGKWVRYTEQDFLDVLERSIFVRNLMNDFFIKLSHTDRADK